MRAVSLIAAAVIALALWGCKPQGGADSSQNAITPGRVSASGPPQVDYTKNWGGNRKNREPVAPGKFDYYLFTLSWAPEYCHGHSNSPECNGQYRGFVVHGLWPQNVNGSWPQACSSAPAAPEDERKMLDIMPDPRLVAHEWERHGTCSGLSPDDYFATIRDLWSRFNAPMLLRGEDVERTSAEEIKKALSSSNPGLATNDIAVQCQNRYLAGVQICVDKNLQPTACRAVRDCTQDQIKVAILAGP